MNVSQRQLRQDILEYFEIHFNDANIKSVKRYLRTKYSSNLKIEKQLIKKLAKQFKLSQQSQPQQSHRPHPPRIPTKSAKKIAVGRKRQKKRLNPPNTSELYQDLFGSTLKCIDIHNKPVGAQNNAKPNEGEPSPSSVAVPYNEEFHEFQCFKCLKCAKTFDGITNKFVKFYTFDNEESYISHCSKHGNHPYNAFFCFFCDNFTFNEPNNLILHIKDKHGVSPNNAYPNNKWKKATALRQKRPRLPEPLQPAKRLKLSHNKAPRPPLPHCLPFNPKTVRNVGQTQQPHHSNNNAYNNRGSYRNNERYHERPHIVPFEAQYLHCIRSQFDRLFDSSKSNHLSIAKSQKLKQILAQLQDIHPPPYYQMPLSANLNAKYVLLQSEWLQLWIYGFPPFRQAILETLATVINVNYAALRHDVISFGLRATHPKSQPLPYQQPNRNCNTYNYNYVAVPDHEISEEIAAFNNDDTPLENTETDFNSVASKRGLNGKHVQISPHQSYVRRQSMQPMAAPKAKAKRKVTHSYPLYTPAFIPKKHSDANNMPILDIICSPKPAIARNGNAAVVAVDNFYAADRFGAGDVIPLTKDTKSGAAVAQKMDAIKENLNDSLSALVNEASKALEPKAMQIRQAAESKKEVNKCTKYERNNKRNVSFNNSYNKNAYYNKYGHGAANQRHYNHGNAYRYNYNDGNKYKRKRRYYNEKSEEKEEEVVANNCDKYKRRERHRHYVRKDSDRIHKRRKEHRRTARKRKHRYSDSSEFSSRSRSYSNSDDSEYNSDYSDYSRKRRRKHRYRERKKRTKEYRPKRKDKDMKSDKNVAVNNNKCDKYNEKTAQNKHRYDSYDKKTDKYQEYNDKYSKYDRYNDKTSDNMSQSNRYNAKISDQSANKRREIDEMHQKDIKHPIAAQQNDKPAKNGEIEEGELSDDNYDSVAQQNKSANLKQVGNNKPLHCQNNATYTSNKAQSPSPPPPKNNKHTNRKEMEIDPQRSELQSTNNMAQTNQMEIDSSATPKPLSLSVALEPDADDIDINDAISHDSESSSSSDENLFDMVDNNLLSNKCNINGTKPATNDSLDTVDVGNLCDLLNPLLQDNDAKQYEDTATFPILNTNTAMSHYLNVSKTPHMKPIGDKRPSPFTTKKSPKKPLTHTRKAHIAKKCQAVHSAKRAVKARNKTKGNKQNQSHNPLLPPPPPLMLQSEDQRTQIHNAIDDDTFTRFCDGNDATNPRLDVAISPPLKLQLKEAKALKPKPLLFAALDDNESSSEDESEDELLFASNDKKITKGGDDDSDSEEELLFADVDKGNNADSNKSTALLANYSRPKNAMNFGHFCGNK